MRETYRCREDELGFKLQKRKSSRHSAITDLDYTDDIALSTAKMDQAQKVLARLEEEEARKVGLYGNSKKTEMHVFNPKAPVVVKAKN